MTIIAGHLTLSPDRRQAFVDAHADLVGRARAHPGCLDLSITPDPFDPARVYLLEVWRSEEDLAAWRRIADGPDTGVEFDDANILKYGISHSGPPFES